LRKRDVWESFGQREETIGAAMNRQFISYPTSGRSWIRYVLHLLGLEKKIYFHHDGCEFSDSSKPPLALDFAARLATYSDGGRVVYLSRDPRDVMASLYMQVRGRMRDVFDVDADISAFIRNEYFGAANLRTFDKQWRELCRRGFALHVTYESCHLSLSGVMGEILDWYGLVVSDRELRAACEGAQFQEMRAVELTSRFAEPWLRPRNGMMKTRRGIVGGHADLLSAADIAYIEKVFGQTSE
jgi:hypothetical protein